MADEPSGTSVEADEEPKAKETKISLTVKTPKEKEVIEVSENATVSEVSPIAHTNSITIPSNHMYKV